MAVTAINNIEVFKNENVRLTFSLSPAESISGWTIVFSLKRTYDDVAVIGGTVTASHSNEGTGVFFVDLNSTYTGTPGRYVYDIQRTDTGQVGVLSIGSFLVKKEVRT